jgi:hypothetical protein
MSRLKKAYSTCMSCGGKKMKFGGKKKPEFNSSNLPTGKGITPTNIPGIDKSNFPMPEFQAGQSRLNYNRSLSSPGYEDYVNKKGQNVRVADQMKVRINPETGKREMQMEWPRMLGNSRAIGFGDDWTPKRSNDLEDQYKNGGLKMKSGGKWIQSAIKKPGSFTAQAKKAGMSVPAFRDKVLANKSSYSSTTVKRANLAKTLAKMRKAENGMLNTTGAKTTKNLAIKTNKGQNKEMPKMSTVRSKDSYGSKYSR